MFVLSPISSDENKLALMQRIWNYKVSARLIEQMEVRDDLLGICVGLFVMIHVFSTVDCN